MKSLWNDRYIRPRHGAKIQYATAHNRAEVAVYGDLSVMFPAESGIGLSTGDAWQDVLMWKYIDADYNYGKAHHDLPTD